ncbi:MAG: serine hydrolase domain-containing protein [Litorimonas sp.]
MTIRAIIAGLALLMGSCIEETSGPDSIETVDEAQFVTPGYALALRKPGETILLEVDGAADIEQSRPITPDTVFHIASLSKQITAAALAHAVMDGRVSLDDPVSEWIPEAEKYGDALQVAHLVYMTSGLTEYTAVPRDDGLPWTTFHYFTTNDAIEASLSVDALKFEPGSAWDYSNINYMLISRIVSQAYGMSFADVVAQRIFEPLAMNASLIHDDVTQIVPNRANAYLARETGALSALRDGASLDVRDDGGLIQIRRNAPHYGGSGVLTSMSDWSLWLDEMLTHETFGQAFWETMTRTQTFAHDKNNDAFGLVHGRMGDFDTLWYSGGDIDASSYMVAVPSEGFAIACFANNPMDSCENRVAELFVKQTAAP